jgi:PST family polysaccharide transporter
MAGYFSENLDNLVVGRTMGAASLGFYNRAFQFLAIPVSLVGTTLDRVMFPLLSRTNGDRQRLGQAYGRSITLLALLSLPATVALILLAPEIVHVLLGTEWNPVIAPFQILALATLPRLSAKLARSMVKATGAVYKSAWRQAVFAPLVLLGALVGSRWGLVGVAGGVVLANVVAQAMALELSMKESGLGWRNLARAHGGAAVMAAVTLAVGWPATYLSRSLGVGDVAVLVIVALVMAVAVLGTSVAFPSLLGEDGRRALSFALRRLGRA